MITQEQTALDDFHPIEILRQGVEIWNRWREEAEELYPDLSGTTLRGADLSGAKLSGVDLSGSNLIQADLSNTDLSNADLSSADLSGVILRGANLAQSDLSGAILVRGNLTSVDLRGANLSGADLFDANLSGANLSGANLANANLFSAILRDVDLRGANLFNAILSDADLIGALLPNTTESSLVASSITFSPELEKAFHEFVEQWRDETGHISITSRKYAHPAYIKIIGMGEQVVPLLLQELRERPDHWFQALRTLTQGEDPAKGAENFNAATQAWIKWGIERGYVRDKQ